MDIDEKLAQNLHFKLHFQCLHDYLKEAFVHIGWVLRYEFTNSIKIIELN